MATATLQNNQFFGFHSPSLPASRFFSSQKHTAGWLGIKRELLHIIVIGKGGKRRPSAHLFEAAQ